MGITRLLRKISGRGAACAAVIVAAGNASRMQGTDKIMADLKGEPVIVHTLRAFQNCDAIQQIIVVTREDLLEEIGKLCREKHFDKVENLVKGGESRAESVQLGLDCVSSCDYVAIHDGARPLVTEPVIRDAVRKAAKFGAAAPAVPVKDTIKVVRGGVVESTPDRSTLYAVQTPQVFAFDAYRAALQRAISRKKPITDDCSAAEAFGLRVVLTQGSEENIKITTPSDLTLADAILDRRNSK